MLFVVDLETNDVSPRLIKNKKEEVITSDQFFLEGNITINKSGNSHIYLNKYELVQSLYDQYGCAISDYISGEYCVIIWDHQKKLLFAFCDHIGVIPLYYYQSENTFALSTNPQLFKNLSSYTPKLNKVWPHKFLLNIEDDYCNTIDENIKRIPSAHSLSFQNGQLSIQPYWKPDFKENNSIDLDNHINNTRDLLIRAIKIRIKDSDNIAFEASGGLDSSALIGLTLDYIKPQDQVHTYSSTYPPDITKYRGVKSPNPEIEALLKFKSIKHNKLVYHNPDSFVKYLEESANILFEPSFSQLNVSWAKMYNMVQQDGMNLLFSGFGGDEFLSTRITLDFKNLIKNGSFKSFITYFTKKYDNVALPYPRAFVKMMVDLFGYPKSLIKNDKFHSKFNRLFLKATKETQNLLSNYLAYNKRRPPRDFYRRMEKHLFDRYAYRLTNCYHMAKYYNVHISYPLLDLDLLNYYFTIPQSLLDFNNEKRTVLRRISAGTIPESIRMETDKTGSSNPSFLYFKHLDMPILIDRLKAIDKNAKIHDYLYLEKVIKNEVERLKNPKALNHKLARIYLLHLYLEKF